MKKVVKTKISELDKTINNREMPNLVESNNVIADKRKELATCILCFFKK
mgnify:CR=1 FL=1